MYKGAPGREEAYGIQLDDDCPVAPNLFRPTSSRWCAKRCRRRIICLDNGAFYKFWFARKNYKAAFRRYGIRSTMQLGDQWALACSALLRRWSYS